MSGKKTTETATPLLSVEQLQEEHSNLQAVNQELLEKIAALESEIEVLRAHTAAAEKRVVGTFIVNGRSYTFKKGILEIRLNGKNHKTQDLLDNAEKNESIFKELVHIGSKSIKVVNL
jgi:cell division septum initiation protein DivIVA